MNDAKTTKPQTTRGAAVLACATLTLAATVAPLEARDRDHVSPPPVPAAIEVPAGNEAVLVGHAMGTQNYVCLPSATGFAWTLFTPQATLFARRSRQIQTHFVSPNPGEAGVIRAAWQDSEDASTVWARAIASSSDPAFVTPGAIPWLVLEVLAAQEGPRSGDALMETTYIQRLNTVGGAAPATGCAASADIGKRAFVPYEADYFFFEDDRGHDHDGHR
jgi:hypothetical protein